MAMRMRSLGILAVLAGSIGCIPGQDKDIEWLSSYPEGLQLARQTGKPLLVEFRCEA
jgi:hypothetical protein